MFVSKVTYVCTKNRNNLSDRRTCVEDKKHEQWNTYAFLVRLAMYQVWWRNTGILRKTKVFNKRVRYIWTVQASTECPGRNVPVFGRMFLKLKYTVLTKNTYIRSWNVTEIMAREKCGLLAVSRIVPRSRDVLPVYCACSSCSLQPVQAHSRCDFTCKVLGTIRKTATLVRVFM